MEETRRHLFGPTWLARLEPDLRLANSIKGALTENTTTKRKKYQAEKTAKKTKQAAATATSGYVNHTVTNSESRFGIFSRVSDTLHTLNLPCVELPIKFANLPDVPHVGGRVSHFVKNWEVLTKDPSILDIARGGRIDLSSLPKMSIRGHTHDKLNPQKQMAIQKLLAGKVIEKATSNGLISNIFFKQKSSGDLRCILNLSRLNEYVIYKHFKMLSIHDAINISRPGDVYGIVDIETAYDSVGVAAVHRPYLQFCAGGETYQYRAFPNGLSEAPRKFTQLLKPVCAFLNFLGIRVVGYIDDMLIIAHNAQTLRIHLSIVCQTLVLLGFKINMKKAVTTPTHIVKFLGFIIDSITQSVSLPQDKVTQVEVRCATLIQTGACTRRELASLIGTLQACAVAVLPAPMYYRNLQFQLNTEGNWEEVIQLNTGSLADLTWWTTNIPQWNGTPWHRPHPSTTVYTDSSMEGWGGHTSQGEEAQGYWTLPQTSCHINYLELLGAFNVLRSLTGHMRDQTLMLKSDNISTLAYLRKMGGTKSQELSRLAIRVWKWALRRNLILVVQHIPGDLNIGADALSRFVERWDYQLDKTVFRRLNDLWGPLNLDLFARSWNAQTRAFFAWKGHPDAQGTDAMTMTWPNTGAYAFPPPVLLTRVLRKIKLQGLDTITLIAPVWKAQAWYSSLLTMCTDYPRLLPKADRILLSREGAPYKGTLHLAAWKLSGKDCKMKEFQRELQRSCNRNKSGPHWPLMNLHGEHGTAGIQQGVKVPLKPVFQ